MRTCYSRRPDNSTPKSDRLVWVAHRRMEATLQSKKRTSKTISTMVAVTPSPSTLSRRAAPQESSSRKPITTTLESQRIQSFMMLTWAVQPAATEPNSLVKSLSWLIKMKLTLRNEVIFGKIRSMSTSTMISKRLKALIQKTISLKSLSARVADYHLSLQPTH